MNREWLSQRRIRLLLLTGLVVLAAGMYHFLGAVMEEERSVYAAESYTGAVPDYYKEAGTTSDGLTLYYLEQVTGSGGKNEQVYRAYDGTYLYAAVNSGQYEATPLTTGDIASEKPQPSISGSAGSYTNDVAMNPVGPNVSLQYDIAGQYLLNYAASGNTYGYSKENSMGGFIFDEKAGAVIPIADEDYGSYVSTSISEGTLDMSTLTMDETIKGNASKAELVPSENTEGAPLEKSNIKAAYLIMETSVDVSGLSSYSTPNEATVVELQNMGNRPMTLVGPSGATMESNGYLPDGFSIAYDASYSSTDPNLNTSTDDLSSETPTVMYTLGGQRVRGVTITDVTDFVKREGYGDYYGYHIPTKANNIGNFADVACGWKLLVLEEDTTMDYSRVGTLQLGIINSSRSAIGLENLNLTVSLGGYKTPEIDDFEGQLFFSSVGSNPQGEQYLITLDPDDTGSITPYYLETRDRGTGNINRGNEGTSKSFGQNIITIDGQRRTNMSSYRLMPTGNGSTSHWTLDEYLSQTNHYPLYTDGMDVELLNITNHQGNIASTSTYHNAYVANGAESISLSVSPSLTGDNYITALGILTEIELPVFKSSITHTDVLTGVVGGDIYGSDKIKVTAAAENITKTDSSVTALTDTQVEISLDSSLTVDWTTLTMAFKNYASDGTVVEYVLSDFTLAGSLADLNSSKASNTYYIDAATNTITINFGTDEVVYASENDKNAGISQTGKLYNNIGDSLEMTVVAKTSAVAKDPVTNAIKITGGDAINDNSLIVPIAAKTYSTSDDAFATYRRDLVLHIRQIVIDSEQELVVPTTGYGSMISKDAADTTLSTYGINVNSSDNTALAFDTHLIPYPENGELLSYEAIIPQYYELMGYVVTTSNTLHSEASAIATATINAETDEEVWLSIYVKPTSNELKLYSWDYKENKLGSITIDES